MAEEIMQNQMNEQANAQVKNKPSKMKKVWNGVKIGLMIGFAAVGGAYLQHKTGFMSKAINKIKNRKGETVQQSFQVRHSQGQQTFNKGGQR